MEDIKNGLRAMFIQRFQICQHKVKFDLVGPHPRQGSLFLKVAQLTGKKFAYKLQTFELLKISF